MRKKLFTFLLALVTSVGLSYAATDDSGDCGANVTYSFNGATGEMVISGTGPMTVFSSGTAPWKDYKDAITSVVVEDGVTSVSQYSFGLCTNLTTVVIGNDVEAIGQFAFNDCGTSFTSLTLGSSLKSVGMAAFLNAKGITTLTLPDGFKTVGDYAFCRLEALQTLNIPSSVTSIGISAFYRCYPLATINCAAVTPPSLGDDAFGDIANKSNIPLNVPNGSVAAYEAAAQWTDFDIQGYDPTPAPANVCGDGLTWELSEGVLTISYDGVGTGEMYDFGYEYDENPVNVAPWKENKSAITTVIVGDGVKSIGNYAFNDLGENFTAVTIANSVERIGLSAFMNAKWITEITLPSSLKTIDRECFAANFGFTSITIPSGVTSIGYHAFGYCTGLTSLTCEATTPPTLASGVFYKIRSTTSSISSIPLYVPSGSVAAYEAAAQWNAFDIQGYDPAPATPTVYNSGSVALSNLKVGDILMAGVTLTDDSGSKVKFVPSRLKLNGNIRTSELTLANFVSSMQTPLLGENAAMTFSGGAITITPINEEGKDGNAWVVTEINVAADIPVALAGITYSGTTPASSDEHITANEDPKNTGVYYSTFFDSANKYALPAGVEAYVAEVSSNALNLTKIAGEGQTIPADNAVILKSSVDQFTLSISNAAPVSFTATNNLHGVDADTEIASVVSGTCYVLSGNSTDGVGFFVYKAPNQLQAHKAYIDLNGSGMAQAPKRMPFVFNGEQTATGVENVQGNVQSTKVIENGVLYIIKNGVKYNAMGQIVK